MADFIRKDYEFLIKICFFIFLNEFLIKGKINVYKRSAYTYIRTISKNIYFINSRLTAQE